MPIDPLQGAFEDLEPPLREVPFVVVDLETTGGSATADAITEIGAVKVLGGETIGEFASLVNPGREIPPQIVMLTHITHAMVADAPPIDVVLPAFMEFARGCVLVAHNAPFDIGFLRAAAERLGYPFGTPRVVDTVRLARAVYTRSEMPSVRLGAIAAAVGARVTPDHRALHDAQATADVLHALIERLGPAGAETVTDLIAAQRAVSPARQRQRHLADGLPSTPGVYLFRDRDDAVLYIGKATNLRARVRSYFTAAESRRRIHEMTIIAARVDHIACATELEAHIREQRLISAHQPRYNRRSKARNRLYWVHTDPSAPSPRPRVTAIYPGSTPYSLGPFVSRSAAALAVTVARATRSTSCLTADGCSELLRLLHERMLAESRSGLYQQAAKSRDALGTLAAALDSLQQRTALSAIPQIVAANPDGARGWEFTVIRHGRLAGVWRAPRGTDPVRGLDSAITTAETVQPDPSTGLAAAPEESATLLNFLARADVRIARSSAGWSLPVTAAGRWRHFAQIAADARAAADVL